MCLVLEVCFHKSQDVQYDNKSLHKCSHVNTSAHVICKCTVIYTDHHMFQRVHKWTSLALIWFVMTLIQWACLIPGRAQWKQHSWRGSSPYLVLLSAHPKTLTMFISFIIVWKILQHPVPNSFFFLSFLLMCMDTHHEPICNPSSVHVLFCFIYIFCIVLDHNSLSLCPLSFTLCGLIPQYLFYYCLLLFLPAL